jgi:hypothetical protein
VDPEDAGGSADGLSTERAAALIDAACSSDPRPARDLLAADPGLALHDFACACATGSAQAVSELLAANPALARTRQGPLDREPLLYACFSRLPRLDASFAPGVRAVARLLLEAGADPNAWYDHEGWVQAPIYGAAALLTECGADTQRPTADDLACGAFMSAASNIRPGLPTAELKVMLNVACEGGHTAAAARLIDAGAPVPETLWDGLPVTDLFAELGVSRVG